MVENASTADRSGRPFSVKDLSQMFIVVDRHMSKECKNPKVAGAFKGICKICGQEGHQGSDCDDKPCFNCKEKGHTTENCKNKRILDTSDIPDLSPDEAWESLLKADKEEDFDDIRKVS